jgi:signal transduction histidine kinase/DNA-binding response OmpR family regulator
MEPEPKVNVLLVDDEPSNLLALEAILTTEGLNLVRAASGEQALMRVLDEDYAIILMDVQMPGLDGFETAELIRQRARSRHTPILFLTAFQSTDTQVERGYALGAVDFLFKPIVPAVLRAKVAVFVELFKKTEQIRRQAAQLVETQRRDHERTLAAERQRWEVEWLRQEAAKEKKIAAELAAVRDELAIQLADMASLHALSERLSNSLELHEVLEEVLSAVAGLQGTDRGILMLYESERDTMTTAACVGFTPEELGDLGPKAPSVPSVGGVGVLIRGSAALENVQADPIFAPHAAAALRAGYSALCSTPLLTRGGELVGVITTYFPHPHDPSERENRLIELYARQAAGFIENARLYREIREADRRKSEFLAMLGHELRNPLAPILNALHLMRLREPDRAGVEQAREVAERQVRHLARLVDDLLDVSRINSGKIELRKSRVDLREAVNRAVAAVRPLIEERRHELSVSLPPEPALLEADEARLEQILANLLNNAAKYTEPGGQIMLDVAREDGSSVVRVRDTGIGIDPELLPRIFDMFTQADRSLDRSQGGLGIGLTLVRRLVELHGGHVEARSAGPGHGSEFLVRLPTIEPSPKTGPGVGDQTARPLGPGRPQPSRILVVDDNVDAAKILARLLAMEGHEVAVAHDGTAALEIAHDHRPDVILLDIGLPGMDGYEVARRLRQNPAFDPTLLIALTGYGHAEDRQRALETGFDEHLVKPVSPEDLSSLLAHHRAWPRPASAVP